MHCSTVSGRKHGTSSERNAGTERFNSARGVRPGSEFTENFGKLRNFLVVPCVQVGTQQEVDAFVTLQQDRLPRPMQRRSCLELLQIQPHHHRWHRQEMPALSQPSLWYRRFTGVLLARRAISSLHCSSAAASTADSWPSSCPASLLKLEVASSGAVRSSDEARVAASSAATRRCSHWWTASCCSLGLFTAWKREASAFCQTLRKLQAKRAATSPPPEPVPTRRGLNQPRLRELAHGATQTSAS